MCWLLHCTPQITSSSLLTSTWFLTHHIPLHMSLIDVTYARSHPPGYLPWFHLCFLPLNSYHILMLAVLLTLSVPLWCLVLILSAPYLPGQPVPLLLPHGYLSFSANIVLNSGLQKGYGANHKILLTLIFIDHSSLTSLLKGHTIMTKLTIRLILACSLKHFPPSFVLLLPLFTSTLTADDFGTFFINKITNLTAQISTPQSVKHILQANINSFTYFSPLSEAEISKLILSSHPTTCLLDPIPSHLLQAISPAVVPALTHIVNTSLHTGIFPSAFKQARITPLLKKPTLNPTLLGNYRPVSLLPFIAKTLERVVFNQVTAFLTQNNLLDSNQSGFRSGHSTETALLSVVEDLRLARTAFKSSLLILLDLSAAFDTVNHQILLSTLLRKAISGTALQWFDSYLSDRSFKVYWRGEVSKSQHLATGVPQGSVLGPLLFSVYMASLGSVIHKHSCLHLSMSSRHFLLDEGPSTQPS